MMELSAQQSESNQVLLIIIRVPMVNNLFRSLFLPVLIFLLAFKRLKLARTIDSRQFQFNVNQNTRKAPVLG